MCMRTSVSAMLLLAGGTILSAQEPAVQVIRSPDNPIIRPAMLPGKDGANINGPSLIRVPDWIPHPLGRYYLYFAHHSGSYIRLAYADSVAGPWHIHAGGTLQLAEVPRARGHIASPDIIVDAERRELRLYFHGPAQGKDAEGRPLSQMSFVATSTDGLHFTPRPDVLGPFYFRVFRHGGLWFAFAKGGDLYRSADGLTPFELIGNPFTEDLSGRPGFNKAGHIRHLAVDVQGEVLWAYFSRIGDTPERIQRRRIALIGEPQTWRAGPTEEVLAPELPYEGTGEPMRASRSGAAHGLEHAVRDPAVFREDGRLLLFYSVAGESGLGLAEVQEP